MMDEARGFEGTGITGAQLDAHITGNWGEDHYDDPDGDAEESEDKPGAMCPPETIWQHTHDAEEDE